MKCNERNLYLLPPNVLSYMHENCPQIGKMAFDKCLLADEISLYLTVPRPKPSKSAK